MLLTFVTVSVATLRQRQRRLWLLQIQDAKHVEQDPRDPDAVRIEGPNVVAHASPRSVASVRRTLISSDLGWMAQKAALTIGCHSHSYGAMQDPIQRRTHAEPKDYSTYI